MCLNDTPDEIEIHSIEQCTKCGASIKDILPERYIVRQIIDIPDIKVKIIENRAEVKICPSCKNKNTVQYGEQLKVIAVYLTQYQLIPYKRGAELHILELFILMKQVYILIKSVSGFMLHLMKIVVKKLLMLLRYFQISLERQFILNILTVIMLYVMLIY